MTTLIPFNALTVHILQAEMVYMRRFLFLKKRYHAQIASQTEKNSRQREREQFMLDTCDQILFYLTISMIL